MLFGFCNLCTKAAFDLTPFIHLLSPTSAIRKTTKTLKAGNSSFHTFTFVNIKYIYTHIRSLDDLTACKLTALVKDKHVLSYVDLKIADMASS